MYYEEWHANGEILCRTSPNGPWFVRDMETLSDRSKWLEGRVDQLEDAISNIREIAFKGEGDHMEAVSCCSDIWEICDEVENNK